MRYNLTHLVRSGPEFKPGRRADLSCQYVISLAKALLSGNEDRFKVMAQLHRDRSVMGGRKFSRWEEEHPIEEQDPLPEPHEHWG